MSFIFSKEVFEDNSFNEIIRAKLMDALNPGRNVGMNIQKNVNRNVAAEQFNNNTESLSMTQTKGGKTENLRIADEVPLEVTLGEEDLEVSKSSKILKSPEDLETSKASQTSQIPNSTFSSLEATKNEQSKSGFSKLDILKSGITVKNVEFPTTPKLEILDLDVSMQSKSLLKGIFKISCKDAMVQITTEIEANLLLLHANSSPSFIMPKLITNDSFTVPITMTFDKIHLEAITNIFVKSTGLGISFNDVNLDFELHCSIKLLKSSIEKRLKASMEEIFKDVLPSVIFNMSQRWFTHGGSKLPLKCRSNGVDGDKREPRTILDDSDLADLSPVNMLRLSTLVSSRQTLCLNPTVMNTISTIPGCLERQNLHRFDLRIPSLNNYYNIDRKYSGNELPSSNLNSVVNTLPKEVLDSNSYDLKVITSIQTKICERTGQDNHIRRRKIRISRVKKDRKNQEVTETVTDVDSASTVETNTDDKEITVTAGPDVTTVPATLPSTRSAPNGSSVYINVTDTITRNKPASLASSSSVPSSSSSSSTSSAAIQKETPLSPCLSDITLADNPLFHDIDMKFPPPRRGLNRSHGRLPLYLPMAPAAAGSNVSSSPFSKLYLEDGSSYLNTAKRDILELRASLYSPIRSSSRPYIPTPHHNYYPYHHAYPLPHTSDMRDSSVLTSSSVSPSSSSLFEKGKALNFVSLITNPGWRWGNDPPPPYRESVSTTNIT